MTDWDARYRRGEYEGKAPHPLVVEFAAGLEPGCALDLACGAGRHTLWLAERGWRVTAVDSSRAAIDILTRKAAELDLTLDCRIADLEKNAFMFQPDAYDLIVVCNYFQRDLFPSIRTALRPGGLVISVAAMEDADPVVKPMNPAYLAQPGELRAQFEGWERLHDFEGKPAGNASRRAVAEIAARRPRPDRRSTGAGRK